LKEIQSKSIAKADLETAAYAVAARCSDETQRYKVFAARHDIRNVTIIAAVNEWQLQTIVAGWSMQGR
jgi:hypothetical protein